MTRNLALSLAGMVSGLSSDMRNLLASRDAAARQAADLFVYHVGREAGALASSLGGLDGLVITAGIGENSPVVRGMICQRLACLGVEIDEKRMIAMHTIKLVGNGGKRDAA